MQSPLKIKLKILATSVLSLFMLNNRPSYVAAVTGLYGSLVTQTAYASGDCDTYYDEDTGSITTVCTRLKSPIITCMAGCGGGGGNGGYGGGDAGGGGGGNDNTPKETAAQKFAKANPPQQCEANLVQQEMSNPQGSIVPDQDPTYGLKQQNNPGDITVKTAHDYQGQTGIYNKNGLQYAVFDNVGDGFLAMVTYIQHVAAGSNPNYKNGGDTTTNDFLTTYAGSSEHNADIFKDLQGIIDPNDTIGGIVANDDATSDLQRLLIGEIARYERSMRNTTPQIRDCIKGLSNSK